MDLIKPKKRFIKSIFIYVPITTMQTSRTQDLTSGSITQSMLNLAYPLILGNLLQQGYNIADTFIIGRTLGAKALATVGSSYTLMVFITSIFIGLCMGCSALFSMRYGAKDYESLRRTQAASLLITGTSTLIIFAFSYYYIQDIITLMQTPQELQDMTYDYLKIILWESGLFIFIITTRISYVHWVIH